MNNIKKIRKFYWEIILAIIFFVVLWALWNFVIKENVVLSDQGLSTIGIALSTSVGVLTAIVVSFVLIVWTWSRQQRSTGFWRFIDALHRLSDCFDANLEVLPEIVEEMMQLTWEAAAASLLSPMTRERLKELSNKVWDKVTKVTEQQQGIEEPSERELAKGRAYMEITNHLVVLTTANFEHRIGHDAYKQILRIQGLLYRLLTILALSIGTVAISVTTSLKGIPDIFNVPLIAVLIGWFVYLLILVAREIGEIVRLEGQLRKEMPPMEEIFRKKGISPS